MARLRTGYLASKPNISASRALACTRPSKPAGWRTGKKVLIRLPLLPGLNDDPAGLEAAFAMLREEAAQGADIAGVELLP